jgi:hypothetical protein
MLSASAIVLRQTYLGVLLAVPLLLHGTHLDRQPEPPQPENPIYSLRTDTAINSKLIDREEAKTSAIETHLEATDARVQADGNRISAWEGGAAAAVAILGVLQILGLVQQFRPKPSELSAAQLAQMMALMRHHQDHTGKPV